MDVLDEGLGELLAWHDPDEYRNWVLNNACAQSNLKLPHSGG